MGVGQRLRDLVAIDQLANKLGPLLTEEVGPGQAPVAADDHKGVDAPFKQVSRGPASPLSGSDVGASGSTEGRPSLLQDASNIIGVNQADPLTTIDQSLQTLKHGKNIEPGIQTRSDDSAHSGIHSGRVPAARQHRQTGQSMGCAQHDRLPALRRRMADTHDDITASSSIRPGNLVICRLSAPVSRPSVFPNPDSGTTLRLRTSVRFGTINVGDAPVLTRPAARRMNRNCRDRSVVTAPSLTPGSCAKPWAVRSGSLRTPRTFGRSATQVRYRLSIP